MNWVFNDNVPNAQFRIMQCRMLRQDIHKLSGGRGLEELGLFEGRTSWSGGRGGAVG
jgi:hypothetical protein